MLMTPITPKVMARPIAASSSTEPSESPYQAFCTAVHIARLFWIAAMASGAAFFTAGGVLGRQPAEQPPAPPGRRAARMTATASSLSASDALSG